MMLFRKQIKAFLNISEVSQQKHMFSGCFLLKNTKYAFSDIDQEIPWKRSKDQLYKEYWGAYKMARKNIAEKRKGLSSDNEAFKGPESPEIDKEMKNPPDYYLHKVFKELIENKFQYWKQPHLLHFSLSLRTFEQAKDVRTQMPEHIGKDIPTAKKYDKKLLLLDLDGTLVYSSTLSISVHDRTPSFSINDEYWGKENIYTNVRPHVNTFLETMYQHYEIAVFTAGIKSYAEGVVAMLDPKRKFISNVYSREDCVKCDYGHVKPISKLGRSLKDVVIVDDCVGMLSFDIDNYVPIIEFQDGRDNDEELLELSDFLIYLKDFEDIREPVKSYFRWDIIEKHTNLNRNPLQDD